MLQHETIKIEEEVVVPLCPPPQVHGDYFNIIFLVNEGHPLNGVVYLK